MEPISLYLVQFNILECQSETKESEFGSEGVFPPMVKQTKLVPYVKPFLKRAGGKTHILNESGKRLPALQTDHLFHKFNFFLDFSGNFPETFAVR